MTHHQIKLVLSNLGKGDNSLSDVNLGLDASIYYANYHNG